MLQNRTRGHLTDLAFDNTELALLICPPCAGWIVLCCSMFMWHAPCMHLQVIDLDLKGEGSGGGLGDSEIGRL
jgi:hypothetical protein